MIVCHLKELARYIRVFSIFYRVMVLYRLSKTCYFDFLSYYLTLFGITSSFLVLHHTFSILLHPFGIIFTLFPLFIHPFGIIFTLLVILLHLFGVISTLLAVSLHCFIVDSSKPKIQNIVHLASNSEFNMKMNTVSKYFLVFEVLHTLMHR